MKKIFISRKLSPDSIFRQRLVGADFEVYDNSLLSFKAIPFDNIPDVNWLFFYSQKGVQYFFEQLLEEQNNNSSNEVATPFKFKTAAFGPATAEVIRQYKVTPYFIGTGRALTTAKAFQERLEKESVCFIRAKNSRRSIQKILEGSIDSRELIVYRNEFRSNFTLPVCDILVFTSPMNAQAYFSKYELQNNQQVVAIGDTTHATLKELGIEALVSELPSEAGLVDACLGL